MIRTLKHRYEHTTRPELLGAVLVLSVAGLGHGAANAETVYFYDGFESQTDPLTTPPTGVRWSDNGIGNSYDLVSSPTANGSAALKIIRDGSTDLPNLSGIGDAGALVAGNVVEFSFLINQIAFDDEPTHNFNAPIQNRVGFSNGVALFNFGTLDGGSENYFVTDGGTNTDTGVTIPRNTAAYDAVRFVLTLTEPAVGQLGGTYEVFIDTDDADGIASTSRGVYDLNTVTVPASESTNPAFIFQRGLTTSSTLYDDIRISAVPEPGTMALYALGSAAMLVRRRIS